MCIVSFVTYPTTTAIPFTPTVTVPASQEFYPWTGPTWAQFNEIIAKLKDLDAKLGLADCEDPEKGAWMKRVEKRLKELEDTRDS